MNEGYRKIYCRYVGKQWLDYDRHFLSVSERSCIVVSEREPHQGQFTFALTGDNGTQLLRVYRLSFQ